MLSEGDALGVADGTADLVDSVLGCTLGFMVSEGLLLGAKDGISEVGATLGEALGSNASDGRELGTMLRLGLLLWMLGMGLGNELGMADLLAGVSGSLLKKGSIQLSSVVEETTSSRTIFFRSM